MDPGRLVPEKQPHGRSFSYIVTGNPRKTRVHADSCSRRPHACDDNISPNNKPNQDYDECVPRAQCHYDRRRRAQELNIYTTCFLRWKPFFFFLPRTVERQVPYYSPTSDPIGCWKNNNTSFVLQIITFAIWIFPSAYCYKTFGLSSFSWPDLFVNQSGRKSFKHRRLLIRITHEVVNFFVFVLYCRYGKQYCDFTCVWKLVWFLIGFSN